MPLKLRSDGEDWNETFDRYFNFTKAVPPIGFGLEFYFVPSNPGVGEKDVVIGQESTLWQSTSGQLSFDMIPGLLAWPPAPTSATQEKLRELKAYEDIYWGGRKEQIEDLEKSVARIRLALDDPVLNPTIHRMRA
ncbi:MAG TPA: hypothetical protein VMR34_04780 [Candidatus Saccharimonadales bacterium]|nr:hypothetical protein [Candidatus Saccharimonadales bacterium]